LNVIARITDRRIDAAAVLAAVGDTEDGAAVLFVGTVRDHNEGRPVGGMRYDAYDAMASRELESIVRDVSKRTGVSRIAAVHRVGELGIGEVSVAVAASSPHRADAFEAARAVIEEIKGRLPVWKHEHYTDGTARWLDGVEPPATGAER
jgi:molybdopterin synthase catalytic subunit